MKYDTQYKGDFSGLEADLNYKAFVGPPDLYDFMGASQFALLFTLGLRAHHRLLDFGCGSLRAGKFFINYLNENCYYGIEPNQWLIEQGIKTELGNDLIHIKKPSFRNNSDFSIDGFSTTFDFIIAQSIFSHTGIALVRKGFQNFSLSLSQNSIIAATFVEGPVDSKGSEWIYPEVVTLRRSSIKKLAQEAGLFSTPILGITFSNLVYFLKKQKSFTKSAV
jgi:hypothetical protein